MATEHRYLGVTASGDWVEPGAEEVAPGVHRLPIPLPTDGLRAVNAYALVDGDRLVLVDSGWSVPEGRRALDAALAELDCSVADISQFLVTHLHRDHYSLAIAVRAEVGTPVAVGAGERESLEVVMHPEGPSPTGTLERLRRLGAAEVVREFVERGLLDRRTDPTVWGEPDRWLAEEELALTGGRRLHAVETPGHTRGHLVFHDAQARLLFAGDHVLPTITPSIGFEAAPPPDPLGAFLHSLARVRAMPDATLLPAHGPASSSVHRRVDELIEHHGQRLEQSESAVASGADTAYEVARHLRWTRRERRLDEMDPFNQYLAVSETAAHLVLLQAQGRVRMEEDADGIERYAVA